MNLSKASWLTLVVLLLTHDLTHAAETPAASGAHAKPRSGPWRERLQREKDRALEALRQSTPASASAVSSGVLQVPSAALELAPRLRQKWQELSLDRPQRARERRARLRQQLGVALSVPDVRRELELHARRNAELRRLRFLAENARSGQQREKLLARIQRLTKLEDERHERRIAELRAALPIASAAPALPNAGGAKP
jgi:hypothetical protein